MQPLRQPPPFALAARRRRRQRDAGYAAEARAGPLGRGGFLVMAGCGGGGGVVREGGRLEDLLRVRVGAQDGDFGGCRWWRRGVVIVMAFVSVALLEEVFQRHFLSSGVSGALWPALVWGCAGRRCCCRAESTAQRTKRFSLSLCARGIDADVESVSIATSERGLWAWIRWKVQLAADLRYGLVLAPPPRPMQAYGAEVWK